MADFAVPSGFPAGPWKRKGLVNRAQQSKAHVEPGLLDEVVGNSVNVLAGPWADDGSKSHRMPVFFPWRSTSCARLGSRYSSVIAIGSPEFSPSKAAPPSGASDPHG